LNRGGSTEATLGCGRFGHVFSGLIGLLVFGTVQIASGHVQIGSGCIVPTCTLMATGPAARISPFPYRAAFEYTQLHVLGTGTETARCAIGGVLTADIWSMEERLGVVMLLVIIIIIIIIPILPRDIVFFRKTEGCGAWTH